MYEKGVAHKEELCLFCTLDVRGNWVYCECENYAVAPLFFPLFRLIYARPPVLDTTLNCIIMPHNYYDNTWHVLMVKIPVLVIIRELEVLTSRPSVAS